VKDDGERDAYKEKKMKLALKSNDLAMAYYFNLALPMPGES
jgi:hypothetical protein